MRLNIVVLVAFVLAQAIPFRDPSNSCLAQAPQTAPKVQARKGPPQKIMHKPLTSMPASMPVPSPPDAKFVTGYQSQYAGEKSMTYVRLTSDNKPTELVEWYRKNLQAYGWKTKEQPSKAGEQPSFSSTKGSITCSIGFNSPKGAGNKATTVMVTFNEPR